MKYPETATYRAEMARMNDEYDAALDAHREWANTESARLWI